MEEIYPHLYLLHPTDKATLGQPYSYLMTRPAGNLLIANVQGGVDLSPHFAAIEQLGGVALLLVTDRFAASPQLKTVADRFGLPVMCSPAEASALSEEGIPAESLPFEEHAIDDELEVFPAPGYAPEGLAYRVQTDRTDYLLSGEMVIPVGEEWEAPPQLHDRAQLIETLAFLMDLDFEVMVGSAARSTELPCIDFTPGARWNAFNQVIDFLKQAENS
ncbi:MAG: hypothetical protein GYB68_18585 [Chloroflexi bacterium]|nr:hypothetical protein [Chloroflexota bacterium]